MSGRPALLFEIGCEEIPARMIPGASADLATRVVRVLDQAGLAHGAARAWGGPRRLAVEVADVEGRQADRHEQMLGPPASIAFDADGAPTRAALGFAKKQGVAADALERIATDRGEYVGFERSVEGRDVGDVLAEDLPTQVTSMSFPKTMRWADGTHRWVRPVHWVVALYGDRVLPVELFGVPAGRTSWGHRFLGPGKVDVAEPAAYHGALESAFVVADPDRRRTLLTAALECAATGLGGAVVDDPRLLAEIADIVEWPGVAAGTFDEAFLELPREILVTTLRHHQKCFSVQGAAGELRAAFLAVSNMDEDRSGHIQRGNEWVVGGRLEDARFFWNEDRKAPLADRSARLRGVALHRKLGSYAEKAERMASIAERLSGKLGLDAEVAAAAVDAARLAKCDLVTGTVGEFPELQGKVGGLLLAADGRSETMWRAVYDHYRPEGPDDAVPATPAGAVTALADKLDNIAAFIGIGELPTGSRDPFGLRRASNGAFRVVLECGLALALDDLVEAADGGDALRAFLRERLVAFLREGGHSTNEVLAVLRPQVSETDLYGWQLGDIASRLAAIRTVREREDFVSLVKLTERVDTILTRNADKVAELRADLPGGSGDEDEPAAVDLDACVRDEGPALDRDSAAREYGRVVDGLARLIEPVERFFNDVLVINEEDAAATCRRVELLGRLRSLLTKYFDIRELAGEANRRG